MALREHAALEAAGLADTNKRSTKDVAREVAAAAKQKTAQQLDKAKIKISGLFKNLF